jgi:hypothetical protein
MSSWITSTWSRWPARSLAPRRSRGSLVRVDRFRVCMWRPVQDVGERADIYRFLTSATEQVCAAGLLPRRREELVPCGARVEVMRVGGKPPPPSRYHRHRERPSVGLRRSHVASARGLRSAGRDVLRSAGQRHRGLPARGWLLGSIGAGARSGAPAAKHRSSRWWTRPPGLSSVARPRTVSAEGVRRRHRQVAGGIQNDRSQTPRVR